MEQGRQAGARPDGVSLEWSGITAVEPQQDSPADPSAAATDPTPRERLTAAGFDELDAESHPEAIEAASSSLADQLSADDLSPASAMEVITVATETLASLGFENLTTVLSSSIETMLRQGQQKPTQAQRLVELVIALGVELWNDGEGEAYLTAEVDGGPENLPVRSRRASALLRRLYYEENGGVLRANVILDATALLEAQALFEGETYEVAVRVGKQGDSVYLDLATDSGDVIRIDEHGWRVVSDPPIRFRRPHGILPLPTPIPGGVIEQLRPFLNLGGDADFLLVVGFIIGSLNPRGPYPVLVLRGEQGSAKSSAERILKSVVDPSIAPLRSLPRDERDLMISARNSWILAFDNLSGLSDRMSDALCRLSTGGGLATRELYTDLDEIIFDARRPLILNGIETVANREDLRDRAIILTLPPLGEGRYRSERELLEEFEGVHAKLLGVILDAVSTAIRGRRSFEISGPLPRMVDFALWAAAGIEAMGVSGAAFLEAYTRSRDEAQEENVLDNPLSAAIHQFALDGGWSGTATALLGALNLRVAEEQRGGRDWPSSASALGGKLTRIAPGLRRLGVEIERDRSSARRQIDIRHLPSSASPSSPAAPASANQVPEPAVPEIGHAPAVRPADVDDGGDDHDGYNIEVPF